MSPSDLQWWGVESIYTGLFRIGDTYKNTDYLTYGGAIDKGGVRPEFLLI